MLKPDRYSRRIKKFKFSKTWKTKSAKDISLYMFLLLIVGILSWLAYGMLISSLPIIIANLTGLFLAISILIAKLKFK